MSWRVGAIALANQTPAARDSDPVQLRQSRVIHLSCSLGFSQSARLQPRTAMAPAFGCGFYNLFRDEHDVGLRHYRDDGTPKSLNGLERVLPVVVSILLAGRSDCRGREHDQSLSRMAGRDPGPSGCLLDLPVLSNLSRQAGSRKEAHRSNRRSAFA